MEVEKPHWVVLYCPWGRYIVFRKLRMTIGHFPNEIKDPYLPIKSKRIVQAYLARLHFEIQVVQHGYGWARWVPESDVPQLNCTEQGLCETRISTIQDHTDKTPL